MEGFRKGQLLRIFIDECDRRNGQPAYTAIVEYLRSHGVSGATVFRGIEGFGGHGRVHVAKVFSWVPNLPVLVEVVEETEKIDEILPGLRTLVDEGLFTREAVDYVRLSKDARAAK